MNLLHILKKWRIALLCSAVNLLHLGQRKIVGLLFVACLERYTTSREQVSFAFMLHVTVYNLCGPLTGLLGSKFGIRSVTVYGCLLSSVSIAACFFAEDITFITICYGIPSGIGEAMATNLLPSLIYFHFKTKQAFASGIALAGPCLGGFLFSPLCKALLDTYGTSGAFLIMGALTLNSIPAAMLLVNPTINNKAHDKRKTNTDLEFRKGNEKTHYTSSNDLDGNQCRTYNNVAKNDNKEEYNKNPIIATSEGIVECKYATNKSMSIRKSAKIIANEVCTLKADMKNNGNIDKRDKNNETISQVVQENKTYGAIKSDIQQKISETKEEGTFRYQRLDTTNQNAVNKETIVPPNNKSDTKKTNTQIWKLFTVLYDPLFLLVSMTTSSHMFIMMALNTIMVDFAIDKGLSVDQGVYLLMCSTVADMVGRFSLGWMTDDGHVSVTSFAAFFFLGTALCYTGFAVTTDFFVVMLTIAVGGVCMGALMAVFPVMLSEYCSAEKNTMALASRYIFMVPISLATAPLIGFFRETLGSYVWMLYFIDSICILCCIILLLIPVILRYRNGYATQK